MNDRINQQALAKKTFRLKPLRKSNPRPKGRGNHLGKSKITFCHPAVLKQAAIASVPYLE